MSMLKIKCQECEKSFDFIFNGKISDSVKFNKVLCDSELQQKIIEYHGCTGFFVLELSNNDFINNKKEVVQKKLLERAKKWNEKEGVEIRENKW